MAATWKTMTYFAFGLPNRPGELARFMEQLKAADIDLVGLWGYAEGEENPRISCAPIDADACRSYLKDLGFELEEGRTLYFSGENQPGALVETLEKIAEARINIEAIETVASGAMFGCFVWTAEKDWEALRSLLT